MNQEPESRNEPIVLDASAVLAVFFEEPGGEVVIPYLGTARISSVNVVEVFTEALKQGADFKAVEDFLSRMGLDVVPFDFRQACFAGTLQPYIKPFNLSLGDRSCIALGLACRGLVVTADTKWSGLPLDIRIKQIR